MFVILVIPWNRPCHSILGKSEFGALVHNCYWIDRSLRGNFIAETDSIVEHTENYGVLHPNRIILAKLDSHFVIIVPDRAFLAPDRRPLFVDTAAAHIFHGRIISQTAFARIDRKPRWVEHSRSTGSYCVIDFPFRRNMETDVYIAVGRTDGHGIALQAWMDYPTCQSYRRRDN